MEQIPVVRFKRDKYGAELLIDVVPLDAIRRAKAFNGVLRQSFYGVMLTTTGSGVVEVDGVRCTARQGLVAFARPGDVCTVVNDCGLDALQLIFEGDFVQSFFNDAHFLDRMPGFAYGRPSPYLFLEPAMYTRVATLFANIQAEIANDRDIHLLRAMLYEVLMLLQKSALMAKPVKISAEARVARFQQLVNEHFATHSGVEFYAAALCITSDYLNRIVRRTLGQSTKAYIQQRRIAEACNLLQYTTLPVGTIAERLGYDTASYFVRSFSKVVGITPLQFRNRSEK